jgi:hypothetical protein
MPACVLVHSAALQLVQLGSPQFKKKIFTQRCFTGISQFLAKKTRTGEKNMFLLHDTQFTRREMAKF